SPIRALLSSPAYRVRAEHRQLLSSRATNDLPAPADEGKCVQSLGHRRARSNRFYRQCGNTYELGRVGDWSSSFAKRLPPALIVNDTGATQWPFHGLRKEQSRQAASFRRFFSYHC